MKFVFLKDMKFVFLVTFNTGREDHAGFFGLTEDDARARAEAWATAHGEPCATIGECVEVWSIT